jgi:glycosyltransferase involved in cell wall biosynthesis
MKLSIVMPCFNEALAIKQSVTCVQEILDDLISSSKVEAFEIILVDDGSTDLTWEIINKLAEGHGTVKGIKLSRNFGHQPALLAGIFHATGDAVITMDADLQDDPALIVSMVSAYREGFEIVFGVRDDRSTDSFFKRKTAEIYYKMMRLLNVNLIENHADFRLMSRRAIENLKEYPERNLFLRGIIPMLGLNTTIVRYKRSPRIAGETKYPFVKMLTFAWEGITSLSIAPLRLITIAGLAFAFGSLLITAWSLWIGLFTEKAVPGWTSTVAPLYFLGGVQLLALGVVGEYAAKIYLETKQRPSFLIETSVPEGFIDLPSVKALNYLQSEPESSGFTHRSKA